jgi:hypothetical protein
MTKEKARKDLGKTRSDKGEIRATQRDLACLSWIAHQYAARGDQIQQLLSRYPDPKHPFKDTEDKIASASTTRGQMSRWVRAGWVVYKRVLATGPGWAYVTRVGLQMVGLDQLYTTARPPSPYRLEHVYAVNQIRLWMDEETEYIWTSERHYRALLKLKRGESPGPLPDAMIVDDGERVAIEVQLSDLKPSEWQKKLAELVSLTWRSEGSYGYEHAFAEIWVYVPTNEMKVLADQARLTLRDDWQERIDVIVEDDLLLADSKNGWG